MAKFISVESRDYPTLALTLAAGSVVDLPDDTEVAGLILQTTPSKAAATVVADPAPVTEGGDNGSAPQ